MYCVPRHSLDDGVISRCRFGVGLHAQWGGGCRPRITSVWSGSGAECREEQSECSCRGGGKRQGYSEDPPPFTLGEGLPPVPAKLVTKILKGDFVDMAELLRDNIEAERRRTRTTSAETCSNSTPGRREVPDLFSWVQCFGVYAAVVASKNSEKVQQLLAYQTMIVREARRCGGRGWLAYDTMFRQQAAVKPDSDWSKLNNSLYSVTFMAQQNGRGRTCIHCLETDHSVSECALAPAPRPGRHPQQQKDYATEERSYRRSERSERICYSWNDGRCAVPYCRYKHVCAKCQSGDHKAVNCPTYPTPKQGGQGGKPGGPRRD